MAFRTLIEYKIANRIDYILDYQLQFVNEESGKRNHHFSTGFEFSRDFDIDLNFYFDREAKPLATISATIPEKNDCKLILSVKYKF